MAITFNHNDQVYVKDGKLGIGTASPAAKLHIKINDSGATPISQQHLVLEHNSATGLGILTTSSTSGYIFFGDESDAQRGYISYSHPTDNMAFKVAGSERMRIINNGNVGIGTTAPNHKLDVDGLVMSQNGLATLKFHKTTARYSYANGYLIATNNAVSDNNMLQLEITGNTYAGITPLKAQYQCYNYVSGGSIIRAGGISTHPDLTVDVFHYNGYVYFWLEQTSGNSTLTFDLYSGLVDNKQITAVSNAVKPTTGVTNSVTITPRSWWTSDNDGADSGLDADLLDGNHGGYYLNYNNLTNTPTLGTAAASNTGDFAAASHNHDDRYVSFENANRSVPSTGGWYKLLRISRGGARVAISYTGGSFTPTTYVVDAYKDWSSSGTLSVQVFGQAAWINGFRIIQEAGGGNGDYYLQADFKSISNSHSFECYYQELIGYDSISEIFAVSSGSTLPASNSSGKTAIESINITDNQEGLYVRHLDVSGRLYLDTVDTSSVLTDALVLTSGGEVEKRTLGSNAFNSTTIPVSGTDFDPVGTDNSTDVTLAGSYDYLTLSGQEITLGQIDYDTDISNLPVLFTASTLNTSEFIHLNQNPVGTTYGDTVSTSPTYYYGQKAGDNDGWRMYGEAPASNDVKMIFEIIDDIEGGDTWVFRNKKTYSPWTANDVVKIGGEGNITTSGKLLIGTVDANTTSTTALVLNGTEVEKRTLGSLAFDSTTLGTAASSDTGDFATAAQGTTADSALQPSDIITFAGDGVGLVPDGTSADASKFLNGDAGWTVPTNTVTSVGVSGDLSTGNITLAGSGDVTVSKSGGTITIDCSDTDTQYTAGAGLDLTGTSFSVEADLSSDVHTIGRDADDKYVINTSNHAWYLDGVLDMRLANNGTLDVDGDVVAFSTVTNSDRRLKTDIETIENASEKVSKLRGVSYTWDHGKRKGQRDIGLIAQEVEEVVPEVVSEGELLDGTTAKRVDYAKLVGLLIESNKELQAQVNELKDRLDGITK